MPKEPKQPPIDRSMGSPISPMGESDRGTVGTSARDQANLMPEVLDLPFPFWISLVVLLASLYRLRCRKDREP